jgi:hypothetical protein
VLSSKLKTGQTAGQLRKSYSGTCRSSLKFFGGKSGEHVSGAGDCQVSVQCNFDGHSEGHMDESSAWKMLHAYACSSTFLEWMVVVAYVFFTFLIIGLAAGDPQCECWLCCLAMCWCLFG